MELKHKYLEYIRCPTCASGLSAEKEQLGCSLCGRKFPLIHGIPVLLDTDNLTEHMRHQIKYFEEEIKERSDYKLYAWQRRYVERFLESFGDPLNKIILDCGTGSGYMAIELAKKGANVVSLDLTLASLVKLQKTAKQLNLDKKILCICSNAEELPLKDNSVDYFISNAVLEHLPNEKQAISEMNRVSKIGAGLMITVPLNFRYLQPLFIPINYVHDKKIGHLRRYDEKSLTEKLNAWNLSKTIYTGHFSKIMKTITNHFIVIFDETKIEEEDRKYENIKYGASNIICFMEKHQ